MLLAALLRPQLGLVLLALMVPIGDLADPILGSHPVRHAETLTIAFLGGWLVWRVFRPAPVPGSMERSRDDAMWTFAVVVGTSALATALQAYRVAPGELAAIGRALGHVYLLSNEPLGIHTACALLEGVGLLAATIDVVARWPSTRRTIALALVASGAATGVATLLLAGGIGPAGRVAGRAAAAAGRFSAAQPDVNAAASSILLVLGLSIGVVATPAARRRVVALAASLVLVAGLVLSGSRTAFVAGSVVAVYVAALFLFDSRRVRLGVAIAMLLATVAGFTVIGTSGTQALDMRYGFTVASARMIAARPVLGIGVGRYYPMSALALPPYLAWWYGRENAHDYFLQLAAELGLIGICSFIWLLYAATVRPLRAALDGRAGAVVAGALAGIAAYLITCLAGHPFLVPETAVPFWLTLGIVASAAFPRGRADLSTRPVFRLLVGGALLLTVPWRPGPPMLHLRAADAGWEPPRADQQGVPFHTLTRFASLMFPTGIERVVLPMRAEITAPATSGTISINGPGLTSRHVVLGSEWSKVTVALAPPDLLVPARRLNFAVIRGSATDANAIDVGTPEAAPAR